MLKLTFIEEQYCYYSTNSGRDKYIPNYISQKVNAIVRLEFELAQYNVAVQQIHHNAMIAHPTPKYHANHYWMIRCIGNM